MTIRKNSVLPLFFALAGGLVLVLSAAAKSAPSSGLDTALIERLTGAKGSLDAASGVFKVSVPRNGAAMGVNTWAAFAGSDAQAVVDGDFAMEERELQAVLKALRKGGIDVVARVWGPAVRLAKVLRSALDAQSATSK